MANVNASTFGQVTDGRLFQEFQDGQILKLRREVEDMESAVATIRRALQMLERYPVPPMSHPSLN